VVKLADDLGRPLRWMATAVGLHRREPPAAERSPATADARRYWRSRSGSWARWAEAITPGSTEMSRALIAPVAVKAGHRVLDLAGGVGDTSLVLGPLLGPAGVLVSTDLVFEMIEEARRRAGIAGAANLRTPSPPTWTATGTASWATCAWPSAGVRPPGRRRAARGGNPG
jgi:hypothetical protein